MDFLITISSFILMFAIIVVAYLLCKKYIFGKVRIIKWIPLSIFAVLFFLWFMDINQTGGPKKKEKQIIIKPKAKPNRVKKR